MKISIVGIGLIGGSMALDLRSKGHEVIGVDQSKTHLEQALDFGLVNSTATLEEAVLTSNVIILAMPVDQIEQVLPALLDSIKWNQTVIDVGSTKRNICEAVVSHSKRGRFVAAHPLSGTEFSGPKAAIRELFNGKKNIICQENLCDEDALETALNLFGDLGMQNLFMNPEDHDKHMAYVSHLSHISAFTLSKTVLDIEKDEKQIFNLASTGFESTARLAKSSPDTWSSIFEKNADHLSIALASYIEHLENYKKLLDARDRQGLKEKLEQSNEIKRVLKGIQLNVVKLS